MANTPHAGTATITGTATENQVLTADTATLADADGLGTLHYQWQRDGGSGFVDVGADQSTYTLGNADIGGIVRVVVSYVDGLGTTESATSLATAAVAGVNNPHTGGVSISGTATEDQVLTAVSTLADIDGLGTLHYQWQRDLGSGFVNVGADQTTYTLSQADVGGTVRVVVNYTDGQGSSESAASAGTAPIVSEDPPTGGVTIMGTRAEDQVLTAVSTLADADGLGTLHYQWQRDDGSGFVNVGADQATYMLGDADVGGIVRVVVSYVDGHGTAESAASSATAVIAGVNDPHTGGVSIAGTATENQVLVAVSALADIDGLGTLHYQWQRDLGSGFVNVGADQTTYTLGNADVGGTVRVVVNYTDGQGFSEAATSAGTAAIADGSNDAPVNTLPAPLMVAANTNVAIAGLAVTDVDSTSLTTTLHVEHGTLIVGAVGGATVVGSGSSTVTLTGSVAQIDAALGAAGNVLYHGAFDFSGIEHLTMTSSDGLLSDTDVLNLGVFQQVPAQTYNGITRPALFLDSSGHIILDAAALEAQSLYGTRFLYFGLPESTPFPAVAAPSEFHLV